MNVHVKFSDASQTSIVASFCGQQDPVMHENLGEVEKDDPRLLAFLEKYGGMMGMLDTPAQKISAERYAHEVAGIVINGLTIATDRDTRATISDKALGAMIDPASVCNLKTANGFVELTAPQILAISSAIRSYVQACFDREEVLLALVEAGTYTDDMLAEGWPDSPASPKPVESQ